jgi:zinc protease
MQSLVPRPAARLNAGLARLARLILLAAGLTAASAPGWALPKVQRVVSPGGIEAWLMQLDDAPLVTLRLAFRGGALQEPEGKYGTGTMAAYLIGEGAGPYDSSELERRSARLGVELSASISYEHLTVSFATPGASKAQAFELLRLALNVPRFDPEPIERARTYYLDDIESEKTSPGDVAAQFLNESVYGAHPMGVPWATQRAGLQRIERADIEAYRRRMLARDNVKIAVAGNIDAATLAPLLDGLLGGLPAKSEQRAVPPPAAVRAGCRLTTMDVPQAVVRFASLTPRLTPRQRTSWDLLETIMDEGVSAGRLTRALRERRGLVYSIGIDYTGHAGFGELSGAFEAKMADVPEALSLVRNELRRMVAEGPTAEELANARPAIVGRTLLGLDTGAEIAKTILTMQLDEQPITHLDDIAGEIESVTREDVWEVAKLLLDPDRLAISIVGQPTQARPCE